MSRSIYRFSDYSIAREWANRMNASAWKYYWLVRSAKIGNGYEIYKVKRG